MLYIGLDVHKEFCQACVIDERGRALSNERFPSTHESLDVFLAGIKDAKFVLESTGIWEYIYEGIEDRGFEVVLAHPLKVRAIAEARVKTDKVDAETLAQLLRADLIPRSWVPSRDIRDLRQLVRQRAYLARQSTSFKNRISAELLRRGAGDERATAGRVQAETRCTAHRDYPGHRVLRRPPHPRGDRRHQQVPRPGEPSRIWGGRADCAPVGIHRLLRWREQGRVRASEVEAHRDGAHPQVLPSRVETVKIPLEAGEEAGQEQGDNCDSEKARPCHLLDAQDEGTVSRSRIQPRD